MVRKILMVCLGNVCRSPLAEGVMRDIIEKAGLSEEWVVDSAAIKGFHTGRSCDARVSSTLEKHNINYSHQIKPIELDIFKEFDYIFGMDFIDEDLLKCMAPRGSTAKIYLLGDFGLPRNDRELIDPYHEPGEVGFERIYQQCVIACNNFFKEVLENKI